MPTTQAGTDAGHARPDEVDQDRLRTTLNRYLAARTLAASDPERGAARAALVRLLQDAGWQPPEAVRRALLQDAAPGGPAA